MSWKTRSLSFNKRMVARYGSPATFATWREAMDIAESWARASFFTPHLQIAKVAPEDAGYLRTEGRPWLVWRIR